MAPARPGKLTGVVRVDAIVGLARWYLGVLLVAMAVGQGSDPSGFGDILATYEVSDWLRWLAVPIIVVEATSGLGLLVSQGSNRPRERRLSAHVAVAIAVGWTILGAQAFARGLALDNCGCFGVHLAQELRWWVLLEDLAFIALAVLVARSTRQREVIPPKAVTQPP